MYTYHQPLLTYHPQMGKEVADRAIQVLGGYGYVGEYQASFLTDKTKGNE